MQFHKLIKEIGAAILYPGRFTASEIDRFYAGDKMSDLLNEASESTLIVTNLFNTQLLRFAEIMDVPGICLLNNQTIDDVTLEAANAHGTTIIVSPADMSATCAQLRDCLPECVPHTPDEETLPAQ
jgi:hypothetical protein